MTHADHALDKLQSYVTGFTLLHGTVLPHFFYILIIIIIINIHVFLILQISIIEELREKLPIDAMAPQENVHIPPAEQVLLSRSALI